MGARSRKNALPLRCITPHSGLQPNRALRAFLDKAVGLTYYRREGWKVFSGGFAEIGFILFVAFLLFGPEKLPEIARTLGKGLGELRRASNELRTSLEDEIANLDRDVKTRTGEASDTGRRYGHDHTEPTSEQSEPRT